MHIFGYFIKKTLDGNDKMCINSKKKNYTIRKQTLTVMKTHLSNKFLDAHKKSLVTLRWNGITGQTREPIFLHSI